MNHGGSEHSNLRSVSKTKRKNKTRPERRKHTKDPILAPVISALFDFFENLWIAPKGPPIICFEILQLNACQKIPPFTILSLRYGANFGCSRLVASFV